MWYVICQVHRRSSYHSSLLVCLTGAILNVVCSKDREGKSVCCVPEQFKLLVCSKNRERKGVFYVKFMDEFIGLQIAGILLVCLIRAILIFVCSKNRERVCVRECVVYQIY